jgi:hypothetical protein
MKYPRKECLMPSRLQTEIKHTTGKHYIFFDTEENDQLVRGLKPDTPEYFSWLSGLKSFHFEGREGRFTARQESRAESDKSYWTAYRKHNHKQLRRYLGTTEKLTIEALENAARHLTEKASSQKPKAKTPRKRPEKREVLYNRIKLREQTIEQKDQEIKELKRKLEEQKHGIITLQKRIQQLENQRLRTKGL